MSLPPEEVVRLSKNGPAAARLEVATTDLHGSTPYSVRKLAVMQWVEAEESRLASEADARREIREDAIVSISRKALATSRSARTIAMIAMVLATIIAAVQAKDQIIWLLSRFGIVIS